MEIQVGEYVRTKKGIIAKLEDVTEDNVYFFDRTMYTTYTDSIEFLRKDKLNEYMIKHSFNIIDLIEVGDYVNGELIDFISISKEGNKRPLIRDNIYFFDKYIDIKSIVTKEQFESIKYEV